MSTTTTTAIVQYAFLAKADPIVVIPDRIGTNDDNKDDDAIDERNDNHNHNNSNQSIQLLQKQLVQLYEMYAVLYPNIDLQKEYTTTHQLLMALQHATTAASVAAAAAASSSVASSSSSSISKPMLKEQQPTTSWWNALFGTTSTNKRIKKDQDPTICKTIQEDNVDDYDDDRLVYTDIVLPSSSKQQQQSQEYSSSSSSLLGTKDNLDLSCIPNEVHSMARYYLSSSSSSSFVQQHRHHHHFRSPKLVRTAWETGGTRCLVIVGLGRIMEFPKQQQQYSSSQNNPSKTTTNQPEQQQQQQQHNEHFTSDRQQLLDNYHYYSSRKGQTKSYCNNNNNNNNWDPSTAHGVLVGPNLLLVHWSIHPNDTTIVFYRRIGTPPSSSASTIIINDNIISSSSSSSLSSSYYIVSWEVVAISTITAQVQEFVMDVFAEDNDDDDDDDNNNNHKNDVGNVSMKITDIHPLVVEISNHAPMVTIAVVRLGGYIELLPLPPQMWYGPELVFQPQQHMIVQQKTQQRKTSTMNNNNNNKKGTKRWKQQQQQTYGSKYIEYPVPDLAKNPNTCSSIFVLNATEYHSDVLGLESFPIPTTMDHPFDSLQQQQQEPREWNRDLYPESPPSDYVLAIYGTKTIYPNSGGQQQQPEQEPNISFWSYSTNQNPSAPGGVGFAIHSSILEVLDLGKLGPDITFFATPTIYRHWRKARNVELRPMTTTSSSNERYISSTPVSSSSLSTSLDVQDPSFESQSSLPQQKRITTISISVPIVGLSFVVNDNINNTGSIDTNSKSLTVSAAVLDWNGGVTMLDCTVLARAAAQILSNEEYDQLFRNEQTLEQPDMIQPLVRIVANRTKFMKQISSKIPSSLPIPTRIIDVRCFSISATTALSPSSNTKDIVIAALSYDTLFLITTSTRSNNNDASIGPSVTFHSTAISCSQLGHGQILKSTKQNFIVSLLFAAINNNINSNQRSIHYRDEKTLYYCAVQSLRPIDIVKSLIHCCKYREAITAAEKLSSPEQAVLHTALDDCRKAIWESEYDTSVLESIRDDEYIINTILNPVMTSSDGVFLNDDIYLFRAFCRLALDRIRNARLGVTLALGDKVVDIKQRLIKLGTYELLCRYQSIQPSLLHFFDEFVNFPVMDLLMHSARHADIVPLSVLWFRHQRELHQFHFSMLSEIPLSIPPILYQHLVPVLHEENEADNLYGLFVTAINSSMLSDRRDIGDYICHHFNFMLIIDAPDESLVWEHSLKYTETSDSYLKKYSLSSLANWYLNRAYSIQSFVSNHTTVSSFAQLALCALKKLSSEADDNLAPLVPDVESLRQLKRYSELLQKIPHAVTTVWRHGMMNFDTMDLFDMLTLTLRWNGDSLDYSTRYNDYLLPFFVSKWPDRNTTEINAIIDEAIQKFCLEILRDHKDKASFLDDFEICWNIVVASRTSLAQYTRLIKSKEILLSIVSLIIEEAARSTCVLQLEQSEQVQVIEGFWKMYESLPLPSLLNESYSSSILPLSEGIRKRLTFLDVLAGWSSSEAFWMLQDFIFQQQPEERLTNLTVGEDSIALMCRLFLKQVQDNNSSGVRKKDWLLSALLNDINELDNNCFDGTLPISQLLTKHLAKPLLGQREILLLGLYLSQAKLDAEDKAALSNEVMFSFNDAVYGSSDTSNRDSKIEAAIMCHDELGKWLPELRQYFLSLRQYLDAAHFIGTVLLPECSESLRPEQIRTMMPLDVVEFVLKRNPKIIVQNCLEWEDPTLAKQANESIRSNINAVNPSNKSGDHEQISPITLPGQPIFHLAQLVGLIDLQSVVAVKSMVIHYAIDAKLDGAAAAICRTLIDEYTTSSAEIEFVLRTVCKVVSREEYDDDETKQELCIAVLNRMSINLKSPCLDSFEFIVRSLDRIKLREKPFPPENATVSFDQFWLDTKNEYGVDVKGLFSSLRDQTSGCVDDALLVALLRYSASWCVGRTTRPQLTANVKQIDTKAIIALVGALFLHIQEKSLMHDCLQEVKSSFSLQHEEALQKYGSVNLMIGFTVDSEIITGLIGRGYSKNGATRSAAAVNNLGFREALQWAVMHSLDPGFDDPIVYLKSPAHEMKVDHESAEFLKYVLESMEQLYMASIALTPQKERENSVTSEEHRSTSASLARDTPEKYGLSAITAGAYETKHDALEVSTLAIDHSTPESYISTTNEIATISDQASCSKNDGKEMPNSRTTNKPIEKVDINISTQPLPAIKSKLIIPAKSKKLVPPEQSKDMKIRPIASNTIEAKISSHGNSGDNAAPAKPTLRNSEIIEASVKSSESPLQLEMSVLYQDKPGKVLNVPEVQSQPKEDSLQIDSKLIQDTVSTNDIESQRKKPSPDRSTLYQVGQEAFLSLRKNQLSTYNGTTASTKKVILNVESLADPTLARGKLSITIPSSNSSSPERSTLYQAGQEAFHQAQQQRRPSSNPSSEDRIRLIAEGRRLLNQARASDPNGFFRKSLSTTAATNFTRSRTDFQRPSPASAPTAVYTNGVTTTPPVISNIVASTILPSQPNHESKQAPDQRHQLDLEESRDNDNSNNVTEQWDFDDEDFDV